MATKKNRSLLEIIPKYFTLWVIVFAALALLSPKSFQFLGKYISYLLGVVMLGMGMTLTMGDFAGVLQQPLNVVVGVALQFIIMPLLGFAIATILRLPPELAAGVVLVGCIPSGTASNVMTFIAQGDVALSVTISSITTLIAPFITPYLYLLLGGKFIPVEPLALLIDIAKIVLLPIIIGLVIRQVLGNERARVVNQVMPSVSVIAIVIIIAAVVAGSAAKLVNVAGTVILAVILHNGLGFLMAYFVARYLCRMTEAQARAVSFEVGMQNSGLGAALAMKFLTPVAALPSAIFSVWHNLSGSFLANFWARRAPAPAARLARR
ncbi:bile acid:sodium symporter family protein [Neomoorella thermoacetica]|uniref:Sodium bile acid symporter family protein n=1 Tax=Neomoorella thermoacetica TaxID=1525 RepID=A0A1J5JYD6_NEOTH|nr:bile acid:sodium symporter family protein [Moorella thermoacetica]OIQ08569.1 sodium bile acid symporter family protein [Moorella thermoacetica]